MDWSTLYPAYFKPLSKDNKHDDPKDVDTKDQKHQVDFADIGCGYGGLLGKATKC